MRVMSLTTANEHIRNFFLTLITMGEDAIMAEVSHS
jgi:hypothetical protein